MVDNGGIGDFECLKVLGMGAHSIVNVCQEGSIFVCMLIYILRNTKYQVT